MRIKATPEQCQKLHKANMLSESQRKSAKKAVYTEIRKTLGLSKSRIGVRVVSNPDSPNYGVLYDVNTKINFDDGRTDLPVKAPVAAPTPAPVVVAKPAVKAAPKPSAKVASSVPGMSPVRTAKHTIEVRTTINGVRKRLGFASSEKAKAAAIAAAKA